MSNNSNNLFNLLKNHEYTDFINILKADDNLELNEIDSLGLYLIHYAILFNQKDIVALLISKKCKLDILDNEGFGIFYTPIKMGYDDIVRLLVYFTNIVIGIPLLEFQDKFYNIPIHYAIKFKKINIINDMLETKTNINFKDINGDTALHLIIPLIDESNIQIINKMIKNKISINNLNKNGQNCLHIAIENKNILVCNILLENNIDIDIGTKDYQLTPLLLSVLLNDFNIFNLLVRYSPNINYQDTNGNTILHHAIQNKSKEFIKNILNTNIDVNLININGNTVLHLFFQNDYLINNLDDFYFKEILEKSKINIQNNIGKTVLHYIIDHNIWEKYYDILINKNIKIYIQDINNITPYDLLLNKYPQKKNKFIDMIAYSIINNYTKKTDKYSTEIKCLKDYMHNKNEKLKIKCIEEIKELISNNKFVYPYKKKIYCVNDLTIINVEYTTYIGISIDVVCGLIYLSKKFKNIQTTLSDNIINNNNLLNYYKKNGITKGIYGDFLNFEIIWSFQKLFYPTNIKDILIKFLENPSKRYLIMPIGIELSNGAHANILIYDKETKSIERFEPYGKDWPPGFNYNPISLDQNLKNLFTNILITTNKDIEFEYFEPSKYEQKIGIQTIDINEYNRGKSIGDPLGFCAAWALWYVEMRIVNHMISRVDLIPKLIHHIRNKKIFFRSVIRSYTKSITDYRDSLLLQINLDINRWFNDNYTQDEWDKFINILQKEINLL